jgi:hypothetical protein
MKLRQSLSQVARLAVPNYLGTIAFFFMFWLWLLVVGIVIVAVGNLAVSALLVIPLGILLLGLLWNLTLNGLWWLVLKLLWSRPPKWLQSGNWQDFWQGFLISVAASLPLAIFFVLRYGVPPILVAVLSNTPKAWGSAGQQFGYAMATYPADFVRQCFWLWLICAFCLYRLRWA